MTILKLNIFVIYEIFSSKIEVSLRRGQKLSFGMEQRYQDVLTQCPHIQFYLSSSRAVLPFCAAD